MIFEILVFVAVVSVFYAIYKHFTVADIKSDIEAAVVKADAKAKSVESSAIVATIKSDLKKYL